MTKCPVCGTESQGNEEICRNCGSKLPKKKTEITTVEQKDTKFCPKCGSEMDKTANVCPKCGAQTQANGTPQGQKSPFIAAVLSLFIVGAGQLYNGQTKKGLILLVTAYIISAVLMLLFIGFITFLIVWLYGMYDAYKTAEAINRGEFTEDTFNLKEKVDGL